MGRLSGLFRAVILNTIYNANESHKMAMKATFLKLKSSSSHIFAIYSSRVIVESVCYFRVSNQGLVIHPILITTDLPSCLGVAMRNILTFVDTALFTVNY